MSLRLPACLRRLARPALCALLFATAAALHAEDLVPNPDTPPAPLKTPPPKHPANLRRDGVSGIVSVVLVIDSSGKVAEASVSKSTHADFEPATLDAVKNWRFKPATKDGQAVAVKVVLPIHFNLD